MLRHKALELDHEFREVNKRSMLNAVSDLTSASVFFIMLARQVPQRQILFRTIGRVFTGLSDTAKAFLIILTTGASPLSPRPPSFQPAPASAAGRLCLPACLPALSTVHNSWWQGVEYNPAAGLLAAAQPAEHPVPHTTHTHTHTRAADILLGYHSEEGWTAFLRLFSGHYGLEAENEALKIFVATVPVFFDSLFKVGAGRWPGP
jgi:hypothetical protein